MQFHSESEFVFAGKSNGLASLVLSEVLFVYADAILLLSTSDFASESMSKLVSLDSLIRIRVRALNGRIHRI